MFVGLPLIYVSLSACLSVYNGLGRCNLNQSGSFRVIPEGVKIIQSLRRHYLGLLFVDAQGERSILQPTVDIPAGSAPLHKAGANQAW